ncbi:MAG TPA: SNF2-related protein, partial [Steroidobacteraceae bacterium]|nr:SNF2-related protein [Steroidobacteraceae bacterium]
MTPSLEQGSLADPMFTVCTFQTSSYKGICMTARKSSHTTLPHQEVGTKFLRERDAAGLFDEQGLGKSKQLIDAISQDIATGVLDGALILCPNILKNTWGEEIEKHSDLRYAVF